MIYIVCPTMYATGGTELLHQLCVEISAYNIDVAMLYDGEIVDSPVQKKFLKYNVNCAEKVVDDKNNVIIIPETRMRYLLKYRHIQKVIWWLSVDNYAPFKRNGNSFDAIKCTAIDLIVRLFDRKCIHLVQSEYAKRYVETIHNISINQILYLSDYIAKDFLDNTLDQGDEREDIVLYNPKKGFDFTNKLMLRSPEIKWIPLINLSSKEMRLLMNKAKVYVDFGNHPGKDRIPREAAISGCCVITGMQGSAKYHEDVPIPSCAKFDQDQEDIDNIISYIKCCLNHYEFEKRKFDEYRKMIQQEPFKFKNDVEIFLKIIRKPE